MIPWKEARDRIMAHAACLRTEKRPLEVAGLRYVVEPVRAACDHPLFDNSAVDGYAFGFGSERSWQVVGEVPAGGTFGRILMPGECVRIFTGAMLPEGADTVVMQEIVQRDGANITHSDDKLKAGGNVRRRGEQLKEGDVVLEAGHALTPELAGLLASVGVDQVQTAIRPKVTVLVTGSEFLAPGAKVVPGRIHSSNDVMLGAALERTGVTWRSSREPDDRQTLREALEGADADLIITTGGVSVGDHDLVRAVLEDLGAEIVVHGVAQKPGKPMLFAMLDGVPVFGLPGNPRAVMVLFWEYVLPFLRKLMGAADPFLRSEHLPLAEGLTVKGDRTEFRAACVREGRVELLRDEGSHMLRSLVEAEALAVIPSDQRDLRPGDRLEVHYLPGR